jgi:hypothetical protein
MALIRQHRLWAITLHSTSLNWPISDLLRSESPNSALITENVGRNAARYQVGAVPKQSASELACLFRG